MSRVDDSKVLDEKRRNRVTGVEELREKEWDRTNLDQLLDQVLDDFNKINNFVQDLLSDYERLPTQKELDDEWSQYLDKREKDGSGKARYTPRQFEEAWQDRHDKVLKVAEWSMLMNEEFRYALMKTQTVYSNLFEEYSALKSKDSLSEVLEIDKKVAEMREMVNQTEKMAQSFREEKRSLWNMMERVAQQETNSFSKEDIKEAHEESIEEFVMSNGVVSLDPEKREQDRKKQEREQAAESAAEETISSGNDSSRDKGKISGEGSDVPDLNRSDDYYLNENGKYCLKGRSEVERANVLAKLWKDEGYNERLDGNRNALTKSEIAMKTDISQAQLFNQGVAYDLSEKFDLGLSIP